MNQNGENNSRPSSFLQRFTRRNWVFATTVLCFYGFCKEMRPSEPFLTEYLVSNRTEGGKELTLQQVNSEVYPVWSYTFLGALIPVFLLTDVVRYKPIIVFEGISYITCFAVLLWGAGLGPMKLMQVAYGFATASEIGYFSYIYAAVTSQHFRKVTSLVRGSLLFGRFVAGVIGQILISSKTTPYRSLVCISLAFVSAAFALSLLLPPIGRSIYFRQLKQRDSTKTIVSVTADSNAVMNEDTANPARQRQSSVQDETSYEVGDEQPDLNLRKSSTTKGCLNCLKRNFQPIWAEFSSCYGNRLTLKWSVWWALGTCGYFQVGNYIQNLWEDISKSNNIPPDEKYNGAVDATATALGAVVVFGLAFVKLNWKVFGELLLGFVASIGGIMLILMACLNNIWVAYIFYAMFRASYHMVATVASFQIATQLTLERFGLVFGFNTFMALVVQAILTIIVVDKIGFQATIRAQFMVTGSYHVIMGAMFLVSAVISFRSMGLREAWKQRKESDENYNQLKD